MTDHLCPLRELRHERRLTLAQVAAESGLSVPYLSQVERGLKRPSARALARIARALNIADLAAALERWI